MCPCECALYIWLARGNQQLRYPTPLTRLIIAVQHEKEKTIMIQTKPSIYNVGFLSSSLVENECQTLGRLLLAPQSGAHIITPFRDPNPIPIPIHPHIAPEQKR